MSKERDPKDLYGRLYNAVSDLLTRIEEDPTVTVANRIAALTAIGRLVTFFGKEQPDDTAVGSAVRKYAGAFNAGTRGKKGRGQVLPFEPDDAEPSDSA